jgi:two-component system chemotaxis sensor kinase CheA
MATGTKFQTDEIQEIADDFPVEATELVASLDVNLVRLESTPEDLNLLDEIFRGAHTLKGASSFLGYEQITGVTHRMGDILNKLRRSQMAVTPDLVDLLLEANDLLGLFSMAGRNHQSGHDHE